VLSVVPPAIVGAIAPESGHGSYQGLSTVSKAFGQMVAPPLAGYVISGPGNGDYRFMLAVAALSTLLSVVPMLLMGTPAPPPGLRAGGGALPSLTAPDLGRYREPSEVPL
jgi:hypothetical protein